MGKTAGFLFFGGVVEFIILHCGFADEALFDFFPNFEQWDRVAGMIVKKTNTFVFFLLHLE